MLKNRSIMTAILLMIVALVASACGGAAPSDGGSAVNLSQSATVTDTTGGTLTINYPEGMTATPLDGTGNVTLTGDVANAQSVNATMIPASMASTFSGGQEPSPSAILNSMMTGMTASLTGVTVGDVAEVSINGKSGASVTATSDAMSVVLYVLSVDGGYVFVGGTSASAGFDAFKSTVEAIAGSVSYAAGG